MRHLPRACLLVPVLLTACHAPATSPSPDTPSAAMRASRPSTASAHTTPDAHATPAVAAMQVGASGKASVAAGGKPGAATTPAPAPAPGAQAAQLMASTDLVHTAGRTPSAEIEAYRPAVTAIVREALLHGQAFDKLASLVATAPHRLSGSPGAAAAVEWVRAALLADGQENVTLEPCMVPHWVRGDVAECSIVAPPELAGERFPILALGGSVATAEAGLAAEVVEITSWEQLDQLADAVSGKLLFFNRPMDASLLDSFPAYGGAVDQRGRGASEAARRGGVGALVRSMTTRLDDVPHTGAMHYAEGVARVPTAAISTCGAERLAALLHAGQRVSLRLRLDCRTLPDAPSANVLGEIVGSELPDEVVVMGGHLDCWDVGQGASDDGGGVCQCLEALRLIRATGCKPRRTIRVVAFMNEENGSRGAHAYFEDHRPVLDRHLLAIESDAGSFTPRGFSTSASGPALETLSDIAALLADTGLSWIKAGGSGGADVDPMRAAGVTVMGYRPDDQRYFDLHHSESDTLAQVSPREINLSAACLAAMAYVVADREERLPRSPISEDGED
ncbi:MAG TPA: M20/M25/M40 family metallo-hydrolase [Planctomycetota bacterium]|nr:M20/M25/M40 family metallo-hydrolase [Planctomycetota bacterium]